MLDTGTQNPPSLPPLVRTKDVLARILADAEASGIGPGGRLPTERRLAEDLSVTRAEIRNALAQLESSGKITRIVGRGTYLRDLDEPSFDPSASFSLTDVSPSDVMDVRSLIEAHSMPLAVAHATQKDIEEMERCLTGGENATTYSEFEAWDLSLHRSLVVATHNPLLVRLYSSVEEARRGQLWGELKLRSDSPERRQRYIAEHRACVDAVKARDSIIAVQSMSKHLASVTTNLLGRPA